MYLFSEKYCVFTNLFSNKIVLINGQYKKNILRKNTTIY